ncbi:putative membrane protein [Synechococcus sp. MVIR-18-1]|nr:putative membrane protein [Synechococcus sp. MVIR-18-1]
MITNLYPLMPFYSHRVFLRLSMFSLVCITILMHTSPVYLLIV